MFIGCDYFGASPNDGIFIDEHLATSCHCDTRDYQFQIVVVAEQFHARSSRFCPFRCEC